ncbi:type II toxin-antitoxin system VapC family toxin [Sphaerisporangium sp. NPDC049002]|uniref:type II toxin-antitoxin system VapC family toxin n=1 Tax=Sphaerisporangium sp. NPDC049002 TaxID=3155392 RepID=UPI0033C87793
MTPSASWIWTTEPMGFLLDTNVACEVTKRRPNPHVEEWLNMVPGPTLYISVMVLGEIRQGVERLRYRDPSQAAVYETWLARLRHEFVDRIVSVTANTAEAWGALNAPNPLPLVDGLLAATARANGWTMVTRNTKDFERTGVRVLNPFEPLV